MNRSHLLGRPSGLQPPQIIRIRGLRRHRRSGSGAATGKTGPAACREWPGYELMSYWPACLNDSMRNGLP